MGITECISELFSNKKRKTEGFYSTENESIEKSKQIKKKLSQKKGLLYGFINFENMCYMNSSLQLLTRVSELKENVKNFDENKINKETDCQGKLIIEFKKIIEIIELGKEKISPKDLKKVMGEIDERYKSNNQEDANEFISNFLSELLEETKSCRNYEIPQYIEEDEKEAYNKILNRFFRKKGGSFLVDLFYGIQKIENKCRNGHIISFKFCNYNMIELSISKFAKNMNKLNLDIFLTNYIQPIKCKEKLFCQNCNSELSTEVITTIYTLPEYLIIFFGRTIDDKYYDQNIEYEDILDFSKYLYNKSPYKNIKYSLECVIEHSNIINCRHYTSLCQICQNIWFRFSDSIYGFNNNNYHSKKAILLLYKKIK